MTRTALATILTIAATLLGFSCSSNDTRAHRGTASATEAPYVVLLVMDEFPGDSLLDRSRRIDPVRYPNFAALAADATWFRNAYSVYDSTTKAVPLILDGVAPAPRHRGRPALPPALDLRHVRPRTATGSSTPRRPRRSARRRSAAAARTRRPAIIPNLLGGRPQRFNRWVRTIKAGQPTLWVKHLLLPHGPYHTSRSGARRPAPRPRDLLHGMNTVPGFHDEFLTRHNEQRYLLQLGFTDRLLGRLIRQLKQQGIYDDTLIVATADHGIAFQVGVQTRRSVSQSNVEELTPVPLFVKRPGQRRGRVSDAYARTLDVTPTIADVLGWKVGYRTDGALGLRADHAAAAQRHAHDTRLLLDRAHLGSTLGGAPARGGAPAPAPVRLRRPRVAVHRHRPAPRAGRTRGAERGARRRCAPRSPNAGLFADVRRASGVVPTQIAGDLSRRAGRRQARPGGGGQRADRGGRPLVLPRRRRHRALRADGAGERAARGPQLDRAVRGRGRQLRRLGPSWRLFTFRRVRAHCVVLLCSRPPRWPSVAIGHDGAGARDRAASGARRS